MMKRLLVFCSLLLASSSCATLEKSEQKKKPPYALQAVRVVASTAVGLALSWHIFVTLSKIKALWDTRDWRMEIDGIYYKAKAAHAVRRPGPADGEQKIKTQDWATDFIERAIYIFIAAKLAGYSFDYALRQVLVYFETDEQDGQNVSRGLPDISRPVSGIKAVVFGALSAFLAKMTFDKFINTVQLIRQQDGSNAVWSGIGTLTLGLFGYDTVLYALAHGIRAVTGKEKRFSYETFLGKFLWNVIG